MLISVASMPSPTALLALGAIVLSSGVAPQASPRKVTIFYTAEIQGTLEPCGCTSDPLGDVARMTAAVRRAEKAGPVLVVDAGSLSYPGGTIPGLRREAADLRAHFLATELARLPFGGSALGETDAAAGLERVQPPRLAANVRGAAKVVAPSSLRRVGGISIGVLGVTDPAVARGLGLNAEDPVVAAKRETEALRARGAELVIALAAMDRPAARQVARGSGADFVVVGKNVGDQGLARAEAVGPAFLVAPGSELQRVGRIDIVIRGESGGRPRLVDAGGPETARLRGEEIARSLADLDAQLASWKQDPSADAAFVAGKKKERDQLAAERDRLAGQTWKAPETGSYFTNQLIPMRRVLPRDPQLASAMRALDRAVGAANLRHATPPPPAEKGRAAFAGDASCVRCHRKETEFWKTTVHAHAWRTLVQGGKTGNDDCVSCHVTGYGEVGGSSLGFTRRLESVQCEACHGPASLHVAAEGLEEPPKVRRTTTESTCKRCHTEKHSDTFQYEAYLRDVLGVGHGEKSRARLGAGPTGHELRSAALARAREAGEVTRKM
jgi:hypothetical protein